ncbi:MAG: HNH endonuclease [Prevotellaceae bacterium]|nr:HNH endonuclease [Candidatus Colivivens equi]
MKAKITYRPNGQKTPNLFRNVLTDSVLKDICIRITNQEEYEVHIDNTSNGINKGRLVFVEYNDEKHYVTLSETKDDGRNSTLQSAPTVLNLFTADSSTKKTLNFYFLKHEGNLFTPYLQFGYKLLMTVGYKFINIECVENPNSAKFTDRKPFSSLDELINWRRITKKRNRSNNSSYITKTESAVQIYAKTYGASKYESTLFAISAFVLSDMPVELYTIVEGRLKNLPKSSLASIMHYKGMFPHAFEIHNTTLSFDRNKLDSEPDSIKLRAACYTYNLLSRIGPKKCALCGCEIPEIIQGAHIWPVADIKKSSLTDAEKFGHATSSHNGMWLCQNHHKLFDSNILFVDEDGHIKLTNNITDTNKIFIVSITKNDTLSKTLLSHEFKEYVKSRNQSLDLTKTQIIK